MAPNDTGLKKAYLKIYRSPEEIIPCLFNPSDYKINVSAGYSGKKNLKKSKTSNQYTGGLQSSMSLTLYCDMTGNQDKVDSAYHKMRSIREYTEKIELLLKEEEELGRPPLIEFIWGNLAYKGVLSSLNQEFNYFSLNGDPLRAKLDLTITADDGKSGQASDGAGAGEQIKCRTVSGGDNLWSIAGEEYGDCNLWSAIAQFNQIMDPKDIKQGQVLKLPKL